MILERLINSMYCSLLRQEQRESIYKTALRVLDEMGIYVEDDFSCQVLAKVGARRQGNHVRISPQHVKDALEAAPREVVFYASDGTELRISAANKYFGFLLHDTVIFDYRDGLRAPRLADVERNAKLNDTLPLVHFIRKLDWQSSDAKSFAEARLKTLRALIANSGKLYWCFPLDLDALKTWVEMYEISNDGKSLSKYPNVIFAVHIDHPLRFKQLEGKLLKAILDKGLPVDLMTQFFAGSIALYSLAGTLVMMTACSLFELVLAQAIRPGAGCLWGGTSAAYNFEKGDASYGGFERVMLAIGLSEMGDFLRLPNAAGSGFTTEVTRYDVQCGIESTLNNVAAVFGPAHMALGFGSLSDGYGMGTEKIVIDHDVIAGLMRIRDGINTSDKHLAFDSIKRVGWEESASFKEDVLTKELMGSGEHYYGTLFDRYVMWGIMDWRTLTTPSDFDWKKLDKKNMYERAHERAEEIILSHRSTVPDKRIEALDQYVQANLPGASRS